MLTCDLIPSNHQKCRVLLIRLSLTHVVACVINGVKTTCPGHTPCKTIAIACTIMTVIMKVKELVCVCKQGFEAVWASKHDGST